MPFFFLVEVKLSALELHYRYQKVALLVLRNLVLTNVLAFNKMVRTIAMQAYYRMAQVTTPLSAKRTLVALL